MTEDQQLITTTEGAVPSLFESHISDEEFMADLGQTAGSSNLQRIRINRDPLNDDEKDVPIGTYVVYSSEHSELLYFNQLSVKPILSRFQYRVWDNDAGNYSNQSVQFAQWDHDKSDEKGGQACGKITGKAKKDLTDAEVEDQKSIKCARILYGLASGTGTNVDGVVCEMTDEPFAYFAQSSSYSIMDGAIQAISRKHEKLLERHFTMTSERKKKGSNTYYVPVISIDTERHDYQNDALKFDMYLRFKDHAKLESDAVMEKYVDAHKVDIPDDEQSTIESLGLD